MENPFQGADASPFTICSEKGRAGRLSPPRSAMWLAWSPSARRAASWTLTMAAKTACCPVATDCVTFALRCGTKAITRKYLGSLKG